MRQLKSQRGIGFVEVLMGGLILGIAAGALGGAINTMAKARQKSDVVAYAVSLESALLETLQDSTTFQDPIYVQALKSRNLSDFRRQFRISFPELGISGLSLSGPGTGAKFKRDGSACSGGCADWMYDIRFDIRELSVAPQAPRYGFAYNISLNPNFISIPAMGMPLPFTAGSYKLVLPAKVFMGTNECDDNTEIGMTGFNYETGEPLCLRKPAQSCPAGYFAVGLRVQGEVPSGLDYSCERVQRVECSESYAFSMLRPALLDVRNKDQPVTEKAVCSFMGVDSEPSPVGVVRAESEVSGTFCERGYDAIIERCQGFVARTSKTPLPCPLYAPEACPPIQDGAWYGAPATYDGEPVPPYIPPPELRAISGRPGGRNTAFCRLNNPPQASGAGWTGYVELSVRCVRQTPGHGGSPLDWGYARTQPPRIVDE